MSRDKNQSNASYEQWLEAFNRAYEAPERIAEIACPNCNSKQLALRFVLYRAHAQDGNAAFWCGHCLFGVALGPSTIPSGGVRVAREDADIPRYRIVPPPGRSGADPGGQVSLGG